MEPSEVSELLEGVEEPSISVSREIEAPAANIFLILVQSGLHTSVDGSDMLRGAEDPQSVEEVGDVFAMRMFHSDMGDYVMENHVIDIRTDERLVWAPRRRPQPGDDPSEDQDGRYVWGWRLESLGEERTLVTEFFDCSRSPQWLQEATRNGEVWRDKIEQSLTNLQAMVTTGE